MRTGTRMDAADDRDKASLSLRRPRALRHRPGSAVGAGESALGRAAARARRLMPGGVTHDVRLAAPFPVAVARAEGSRKWDLDGHELICYVLGHGALLLGHGHPAVVAAVQQQATRSFHPGACHELESGWAELVIRLVPSAERVPRVLNAAARRRRCSRCGWPGPPPAGERSSSWRGISTAGTTRLRWGPTRRSTGRTPPGCRPAP